MTTRPAIMDDLLILAARLPFHDKNSNRLRIAVTEEELQKMRGYCLETQDFFATRIRDIQLVVEVKPLTPDLFIEHAEDQKPFGKYEIRRTL